jgi:heme-degrading monooxygenase HmoA
VVQYIWEFEARPEKIADFERFYSASGPWAALFRRCPGFLGTSLLRDAESPARFLTIDRWDSAASRHAMREQFSAEYETLDRDCEALTESETRIGVFESQPAT